MNTIYFCSTLKSDWNRKFNPILCHELEKHGLTIYLPQRDTNQDGQAGQIFEQNYQTMIHSKVLLAIAKNTSPNWGAEVGFFCGKGKPVLILAELAQDVPLMTSGMAKRILFVECLDQIAEYIERLHEAVLNL